MSSTSNKAKDMTIKYTDIEVERISASELQEMGVGQVQQLAFVRYDHRMLGHDQALLIQLPKIHIDTYGVPRAGVHYKNDSDRSFVKVPLNESEPDVLVFANKLKEIDTYLSSPKFASRLLGKKWQKYTYVPCYRPSINTDDEDDDDDDKKKSTKKPALKYAYMKLKLDTDYDSGKIKTQVYRPEIINNKRERIEVNNIESIDDFSRILCYQCKILAIIRGAKIWAQPPSVPNPKWGATFKMIKVEVEPPVKNTSTFYKDYMNSDAFLDSEEESNIPNKQAVQVDSDDSDDEEKPKPVKKVVQDDSDDSDDKNTKPIAKTSNKKVVQVDTILSDNKNTKSDKKISVKKVSQVDSDDSDDEEPKPVKKISDKKVVPVESDDSDEEEPKPVKKIPDKKVVPIESDDEEPKPVKKTHDKKIVQVDSDDSDEEPKPVKKIPDKKVVPVESDDSDEEETKPVKKIPAKKTHDKKVVPVESDDSDDEPKSVKKPSSKKVIHVESDSDDDKPHPPAKKSVSKTTGARSGKK